MGAIGSAVSGAFGLAQTAIQNNFDKRQSERQFEYDKEMAALQNQYNIDMWNMQNAYNSPAAQMNRLKEAGLNPNLMYGQGSTGNASSAPQQVVAGQKAAHKSAMPLAALGQAFDALSLMSEIEGYKQKRLQTSLLADQERQHFFQANLLQDYYLSRSNYSRLLQGSEGFGYEASVVNYRDRKDRLYYDRPGFVYDTDGMTSWLGYRENENLYRTMQKNYEDLGYQVDMSNYRKQMLEKDLDWYSGNQWFDWITRGLSAVSSLVGSVSRVFGNRNSSRNFQRSYRSQSYRYMY